MNPLHLLWIVPLAVYVGFFLAGLCFMASDAR